MLATELTRPGVPLKLLARQFWPYWLGKSGLSSSRELPSPSAREDQAQPVWVQSVI